MSDQTAELYEDEDLTEPPLSKFSSRLHDAITAFLLLVAFPFGFALLALSSVFGRSMIRAFSVVVFLCAVHLVAGVNIMLGNESVAHLYEHGPNLVTLLGKGLTALLPNA